MSSIKTFLQSHTPYDILPVSLKVVAMDSTLCIRQCISVLLMNGIVAAPIWNIKTQTFFGLFTVKDIIHLLVALENEQLPRSDQLKQSLDSPVDILRDIDANRIGLQPIHIHPLKSLEDATQLMIHCHLHHIALIDADSVTHQETLVSVLTGFKILKFLACNCPYISQLHGTLQELNIGTYQKLHTVKESSKLMVAIRLLQKHGYSSLPVVNDQDQLINIITETDILCALQEPFNFKSIDIPILDLLQLRSSKCNMEKICFCRPQDTLAVLFYQLQSMDFTPRFMVVSSDRTLLGIISIGDLLQFICDQRKNEPRRN